MASKKELILTVAWLCGLVSSDGYVGSSFEIFSSEKDWINIIEENLNKVGIECSVWLKKIKDKSAHKGKRPMYCLYVKKPREIEKIIKDYNLEKYLMPRKWQKFITRNKTSKPYHYWKPEEEEYIKRNYQIKDYVDIARDLKLTRWQVQSKAQALGLKIGRGKRDNTQKIIRNAWKRLL
ncbi:MAG: hypothetical protein ACTSYW_10445 [Candidatus Heimdallarchaeota archaeon]